MVDLFTQTISIPWTVDHFGAELPIFPFLLLWHISVFSLLLLWAELLEKIPLSSFLWHYLEHFFIQVKGIFLSSSGASRSPWQEASRRLMKPKDPQETVKALVLLWHSGSARRSVWVSFQLVLMDSRDCSCSADLTKWHRSILSTANRTGKSWPLFHVVGAEQVFLVTMWLPFFFNLLLICLMPCWTAAAGLG